MRDLAEVRGRLANSSRPGSVHAVVAETQRVRLRLGGTDAEPFLSPWAPYSQIAGALKVHTVPSVGQQMMLISPSGDPRQAVAMPFTWSDDQPSPSEAADEVVISFGDFHAVLTESDGLLKVTIGEMRFELGPEGLVMVNGDTRLIFRADHVSLRSIDKFLIVNNSQDYGVIHSPATEYPDAHPGDLDL